MQVVVVGGGIAGCSAAYELARRGLDVLLLERAGLAAGASGRNTGTLLNQAEPEVMELKRLSLSVYDELRSDGVWFERVPQLLLAADEGQVAAVRARAEDVSAAGVATEWAEAVELCSELPQLSPAIAGGMVAEGAAVVDGLASVLAYAERARHEGATIRTGVEVAAIAVRGDRVEGVRTAEGQIAADAVVLASGPWLGDLWSGAPVSAGRGWLLRTRGLGCALPWIVEEISWPDQDEVGRATVAPTLADVAAGDYFRPAAEAFVLAPATGDEALLGASLAPSLRGPVEGGDVPSRVARRALALAPGLDGLQVRSAWHAHRPTTPDGLPLVGATGIEGLFVHGGHGSLGVQAAPATAPMLADAILGEEETGLARRLSPMRNF